MLGVDNDNFDVPHIRKQGLYTPYDDGMLEDEHYYQELENVIIETPKEYELRRKKNQEAPKKKKLQQFYKKQPYEQTQKH